MDKREFLKGAIVFVAASAVFGNRGQGTTEDAGANEESTSTGYDASDHWYGMGVDIDKCIGCGRCIEACDIENDVPDGPFFTRTWVERYVIKRDKTVVVEDINEGGDRSGVVPDETEILRTFFVPKLCNQCEDPPCVQVCPVGATFSTEDGVVVIDEERCIGCRYCIQACPYGARFLNPKTRTADKCTFCYHRVVAGMLPACVEACPTQARIFGDLKSEASGLVRFERLSRIHVLKPHLNTKPKVYYSGLDGEVR